MKGGAAPAAVAPGGASSAFLGPEQLDRPISFEALAEAGSMLGSGAAVFVAQGRDLLEVGLNVARFFARESCGKCVPCRVGSRKAIELLERDGDSPATRARLEELHQVMFQTSLCGLGQVALAPLLSLLRRSPPP
jgi:NADH:ubiquinone oxidoreductase subunit F (NADH-binding)